jgi:hypothetical protein
MRHQLGDGAGILFGQGHQLRRGVETKWDVPQCVCRGVLFAVLDDESPADGEIGARQQRRTRPVEGLEDHAVAVKTQGVQQHHQIKGLVEGNVVGSRDAQRAVGTDLGHPPLPGDRIDGLRVAALEPQQDRADRPVPRAGGGQ